MKAYDLINNKKIIAIIKMVICIIIAFAMIKVVKNNVIASYQECKVESYRNEQTITQIYDNAVEIMQEFEAAGTFLSNIEMYIIKQEDFPLEISVLDENRNVLLSKVCDINTFDAETWNSIGVDLKNLKKGNTYYIKISGEKLSTIGISSPDERSYIWGNCMVNGEYISGIVAIGVQYTKTEIEDKFGFAIHLFMISVLSCIIFYVVICFERIYVVYRKNRKNGVWLYALYFSLLTVFSQNPIAETHTQLLDFKRIIGHGVDEGVDVSRRIANFNWWFLCLAGSYIVFFLFFNDVKHKCKTNRQTQMMGHLDNIVVLADVLLGLRSFSFFSSSNYITDWLMYSDYILFAVIVLGNIYILFQMDKKIECNDFFAIMISCWLVAYPVTIFMSLDWRDGRSLLGVQYILFFIMIVLLICFKQEWLQSGYFNIQKTLVVFLAFIPFFLSAYIEMVAVLNQRGIFVAALKKYFLLMIVLWVAVAIVVAHFLLKKKKIVEGWKKVVYPIIIFGIFCLWQQAPISSTYDADIIESANASILISDFLNFGEIPIVQHYGGHMMTGVWEGIFYGILNNDTQGAIFSPYAGYIAVVVALLVYYLIREYWNEDMAFLVVLMFPFYGIISYWGLGIFLCITIGLYIKKNTYLRAAFIWFAFIWCALYRLDLGFSFFCASVISLFIYILVDRNLKACKQLSLTLLIWICIGGVSWFGLCMYKGIDPINRLLEFINLSMSNYNWAYSFIGDFTLAGFAWSYILIPFTMTLALLYLVFSKNIRNRMKQYNWVILLVLGFAYFFNFSRSLVRHSFAEGKLYVAIWTAYLFLAIMLGYLKKERRWSISIFAILMVINGLFLSSETFSQESVIDAGTNRIGEYVGTWKTIDGEENYWTKIKRTREKIQRVVYNAELNDTINDYGILINALLESDETYVDFMNRSFLYSALQRRDPVYVSQSPLQLSGEYTQQEFINQIKDIPLVIMPYDENVNFSEILDGVSNNYRYYRVAEYIYQNYVPLCTYENKYALWCLPERYDTMSKVIKTYCNQGDNSSNVDCKLVQYGYDGPYWDGNQYAYLPGVHQYDISKLPVIWAEADEKKACDNPVVENLQKNEDLFIYKYVPQKQDANGNYMKVHIDYYGTDQEGKYDEDDETTTASLILGKILNGKMDTKFVYNFFVLEGQHDYIFRVSSDYYWYIGDTNAVKVVCNDKIYNVSISILEGD